MEEKEENPQSSYVHFTIAAGMIFFVCMGLCYHHCYAQSQQDAAEVEARGEGEAIPSAPLPNPLHPQGSDAQLHGDKLETPSFAFSDPTKIPSRRQDMQLSLD